LIPQEQFVAIANYIWAAMALILGGNVTTIRRASSLVSNLAADSPAGIPSLRQGKCRTITALPKTKAGRRMRCRLWLWL
jgi:hypothetical protein